MRPFDKTQDKHCDPSIKLRARIAGMERRKYIIMEGQRRGNARVRLKIEGGVGTKNTGLVHVKWTVLAYGGR